MEEPENKGLITQGHDPEMHGAIDAMGNIRHWTLTTSQKTTATLFPSPEQNRLLWMHELY